MAQGACLTTTWCSWDLKFRMREAGDARDGLGRIGMADAESAAGQGNKEGGVAYASHIDQGGLHVVFTAKPRNIDRAVAEIEAFVSQDGAWPLFDIKLIVREALINAVLHGGPGGGGHEVSCTVRFAGDTVECTVSDPGPGFDWRARCGRIPPLDAESGRGVCIMEAYADVMEYNAAGNVVRLVKKRGGESCGTPRCPDEAGKTK